MNYKPFGRCSNYQEIINKLNEGIEVDNIDISSLTNHLVVCEKDCKKLDERLPFTQSMIFCEKTLRCEQEDFAQNRNRFNFRGRKHTSPSV